MKRVLSLALVFALIFSLSATGYAATGKITGIEKAIDTNTSYNYYDTKAGTVYNFPLTSDMFSWDDGSGKARDPVTRSQLSNANITVRTSTLDNTVVKKISIVDTTPEVTNKQRTATVQVEFVTEFASVSSKDFRFNVYLAVKSNRSEASKITIEGTMENPIVPASSSTSYVDLSGGKVLEPSAYIRDLEVFLGAGVLLHTRVYSDRKYYGIAKEEVTSADSSVLDKYDIDTIINLKTINFSTSGKIVTIENYDGYHVYGKDGKYLGTAPNLMEYSEKYYLSQKKISMDTTGSSSSSSSSSQSGTGGTPNASGSAISVETARAQTQSAVSTAKASGSSIATVRVKDASSISASALQTMSSNAGGLTVRLVADTMTGNAVTGRLTINPANAANLTGDIKLGVYVDSTNTSATRAKFERWFKNNIQVVSFAQPSGFGMTVNVAAKTSMSGLNTSNLYFYSYNKSTNQYSLIQKPSYSIDANGYLHFSTSLAGDIIISDGALARK